MEVYQDGAMHSASALHGQGSTFLAWEPYPMQSEIEADPEFHVRDITEQEFEQIWKQATSPALETIAV